MSERIKASFSLDLIVHDRDALYIHALHCAVHRDGMDPDDAVELLRPGGQIDLKASIQMVFDPGVSPPGVGIEAGSTELYA